MAFKDYVGGFMFPNHHIYGTLAPGFALNTAAHRTALIFQAPKAGVIDTVEFLTGSSFVLNAASVIRISLQNVATSGLLNGFPDGVQDQRRDISGSLINATNVWHATALMTSDGTDTGTKRTVALGELMAVVWEYQTFTASDSLNLAQFQGNNSPGLNGAQPGQRPYVATFAAGTWSKGLRAPQIIALKYSDGSYAYISQSVAPVIANPINYIAVDSNPDEIGARINLPFQCRVGGAWARLHSQAGGAAFELTLYDVVNNVLGLVEFPVGLYDAVSSPLPLTNCFVQFSNLIRLEKNTDYRLTIRATSPGPGKVGVNSFTFFSSARISGTQGAGSITYTQRTDGGVWLDDPIHQPIMGLQIVSFGDGLGAGVGGSIGRSFRRGMV